MLCAMRILRTYARVYTTDLDTVSASLAAATGEPVTSRFSLPNGPDLATVGEVLVVAGDEEALAPYRETVATLLVDDLDACRERLDEAGAELVRGPRVVPTGRNLTARLPGGLQLEYVEWSEEQWERAGGRPA
ncbi:hypothetical protein SAMN05216260_112159 [Streptomyces griseoaurantiacus]|uniref:VOC domain-containing protein n=2 Tax=Streptomyces TaxID=1883 RepID=A0A1G7Q7K0_9ACTN|nr:hypothetical protein SAMN05216260_112159 [Streptomyces jietaisiensis]